MSKFVAHAEVNLGQLFNLDNPRHYATMMALAQHHGVPTPLLDWSRSPYVAAFFAFSDALENRADRTNSTHVRIYALSDEFVRNTSPIIVELGVPLPFVSSLEVAPIHNPRLYVQQGSFLVTNIGHLESYICAAQSRMGKDHLEAVDIPIEHTVDAMQDLEFMGLTAANMYPGLDGIGRMFKHNILATLPHSAPPQKVTTTDAMGSKVGKSESPEKGFRRGGRRRRPKRAP